MEMIKLFNTNRIKELAKEKGLKTKWICSQLGLAESYLSDVSRGKNSITDARLQVIADLLDTTPEYLKGETDEKEKPSINDEGQGRSEFLAGARRLTPERQQQLLDYMKFLLAQQEEQKDKP